MPFTIRILDAIPEFITVQGINGPERRRNPEPVFYPPQSYVQLIWQDKTGLYGSDPARRVELWEDVNGVATLAEVKANCPGFLQSRLALIRANAKQVIEAKWPLWAQNNCALGLYAETVVNQCKDDISTVITVSNTAEDDVLNAVSIDAVLAVNPTWPVL
jgi:hypothetical protein